MRWISPYTGVIHPENGLGEAGRDPFVAGSFAGDAGLAAGDGDGEGDEGRGRGEARADVAAGVAAQGRAGGDRSRGHDAVHAAEEPAIADADLPAAGRDPQEQEPARCPLQQDRCRVELDHVG